MIKTTLSSTQDPRGFEVRLERIELPENPAVDIESTYTPEGWYIGDLDTAVKLTDLGIKPELSRPNNQVCSIGFCDRSQKWYGWSHRAICGFGIGDVAEVGDAVTESGWIEEYLEEHPELDTKLPVGFVAHTLEDCRKMAIAFADSVS